MLGRPASSPSTLERLQLMRPRLTPLRIGVIALALVLIIAVGAYGTYLANEAGRLPWQEEPTRIPITPFADIPGFGGTPVPTETSLGTTGALASANPAGIGAGTIVDAHIPDVIAEQGVGEIERHGSQGI